MSYRDEMRDVHREARWTVFKFLPLLLGIIIVFSALGFALNSLGLFGSTVVERKVFENSFQYSESVKAEIATNEATLAEIESQLLNPNLDDNTRYNLEAQKRAISIRLATARSKQ